MSVLKVWNGTSFDVVSSGSTSIAFVDSTTDLNNSGGTLTLADADLDPIEDGDLLVIVAASASGGISLPAGFEEVINNSSWSGSRQVYIGSKKASSESGDYSVTHSGKGAAVIMVFRSASTLGAPPGLLVSDFDTSIGGTTDFSWTPSTDIYAEAGDVIIEGVFGDAGTGDGTTSLSSEMTVTAELVSTSSGAIGMMVGYYIPATAVEAFSPTPGDSNAAAVASGAVASFRKAV